MAMWELWATSKEWSTEAEGFTFYGSFPALKKRTHKAEESKKP